MDGDKPAKDGFARNKQSTNQNLQGLTSNQGQNVSQDQGAAQGDHLAGPRGCNAQGLQESAAHDLADDQRVRENLLPMRSSLGSRDLRHSFNSVSPANGASSNPVNVNNAVCKTHSSGALSSSPPVPQAGPSYPYLQTNKRDTMAAADFLTSFPVSGSKSVLGNGCSSHLPAAAACSANALKTANSGANPVPNTEPHRLPSPHVTSNTPASSPPVNHNHAAYNWQATKTNVRERLAYLFSTDIMTDIQFKVGKSPGHQVISAHKFVLSIGSAVFDALFNGRLATFEPMIEIPDVEPAAFSALLKFLYTDEVQIGPETVMTTLYTAKKYAVPALERACVEFLKRNLSPDNAFMLLTQARLFDEPQLAALCLETIDKNTSEALAADGFTDIDLATLCVVLERDTLGIRECKLFTSVCRWAEAECTRQDVPPTSENQRRVLSRGLRLIRFPLMTVEEFAVGSAQSGLLEDREVVELFLYFTVNPKPQISFLDVPRCCLTGKEQVVSRFCQIESRWGYSGTSDRIRFMVNRRIFVVGFGLYGSIHGPTEYTVNIQIIHMDSTKVVGSNDPVFQCDGSTSTCRVMFKEPVEVLPNTSYIAAATLKGPDSYYGSKGLRKVTHESLSSGKVTFQFTYAAGNNNGTSVEDGQIPEIIFYT